MFNVYIDQYDRFKNELKSKNKKYGVYKDFNLEL